MKDKDLRVVIAGGRSPSVARDAYKLVRPFADICAPASAKSRYASFGKAAIFHPDDLTGAGQVRHWILERWKQKCVVILEEAVFRVLCLVGRRPRAITDPEAIRRLLLNAANITEAIGASLFSFGASSNIVHFTPYDPFSISKLAGGAVGFVGRKILPDPKLDHAVETDLNLQGLLKDRIVWQDTRFVFDRRPPAGRRAGAPVRVQGSRQARPIAPDKISWSRDRKYLAQKWGAYIAEKHGGGVLRMAVTNVVRREKFSPHPWDVDGLEI
jgi:hypothetical protein